MGPAAAAMAPIVLAIGFIEHLLYGAVLGTTIAAGVKYLMLLKQLNPRLSFD